MSINSAVSALLDKQKEVLSACPELTFIGDPVLRNGCVEVTLMEGLKIAKKLIRVLSKCREITGYGRGLAAPQIGLNKRVFVTFVDDKFTVYMNPIIMHESGTTNFYRELCLSSSCLWADVERPDSIVIKYRNERGTIVREGHGGFLARLLQHECDHLNGVINLDKAVEGSIEFVTRDPLKETMRGRPDTVR
jgi:peptide deformylase